MKLHWAVCEEELLRMLLGAPNAPATDDAHTVWQANFGRAVYFCPPLRSLRGFVNQIHHACGRVALVQKPGPASMKQAMEGNVAISLRTVMVIVLAIRAILDAPTSKDTEAHLVEALRKAFPHPGVLPDDAIVPSYFTLDATLILAVRDRLRPGLLLDAFSAELMAGKLKSAKAERHFLDHVLNGFSRGPSVERGAHKVTERTARVVHEALRAMADDPDFPAFEAFARPDAEAGDRHGQASCGLRPAFGNLV